MMVKIKPERPEDLDELRAELERQPWADNREYTIWLIDMIKEAAEIIDDYPGSRIFFEGSEWLAEYRGNMTDQEYHFIGCWRDHHECAKALLEQLATEIRIRDKAWHEYDSKKLGAAKKRIYEIAREVLRDTDSGAADV